MLAARVPVTSWFSSLRIAVASATTLSKAQKPSCDAFSHNLEINKALLSILNRSLEIRHVMVEAFSDIKFFRLRIAVLPLKVILTWLGLQLCSQLVEMAIEATDFPDATSRTKCR